MLRWLRTAPAGAEVELFDHAADHFLADSELLSNLGLAQVGPTDEYLCQLGIEAEADLFDPFPQIDLFNLRFRSSRGGDVSGSNFLATVGTAPRRVLEAFPPPSVPP